MKTLTFIRHGQTDFSLKGLICGRIDEPLNETGKRQVASLVGFLKAKKSPDIIFASPLTRARQSAEIIAQALPAEIKTEDTLIEMAFGEWEGNSFADMKAKYPDLMAQWNARPHVVAPPGAERADETLARVRKFTDYIFNESHYDNVYAVTHGGPIRAAIFNSLHIPVEYFWNMKIQHGSATIIEYEKGIQKLVCMGQVVDIGSMRSPVI